MIKARVIRLITATILVLFILLGAMTHLGCGTVCSLDLFGIAFTCPLGFLQMSLASRTFVPKAWLSVGMVVLATILLGRFFCAWLCPTLLVKAFFKRDTRRQLNTSLRRANLTNPQNLKYPAKDAHEPRSSYSSYAVLAGALTSSFIFGFPVFCLVCPMGLFIGSLFAVKRLFFAQQMTFELILFPAVLLIEIFALRSWCGKLCPLGALLNIVGSLNNRFLRPSVNREACIKTRDLNCHVCMKVCPEGIDLGSEHASLRGCTNCLECWERCPKKAIRWLPALWRKTIKSPER